MPAPISSRPAQPGVLQTAVVVNPTKVPDRDALRRTIAGALTAAGWPEPMWLETTVDDPAPASARRRSETAPSSSSPAVVTAR